jgi:hypothetical protein
MWNHLQEPGYNRTEQTEASIAHNVLQLSEIELIQCKVIIKQTIALSFKK